MDEELDKLHRFEEHRAHLHSVAYRMLGSSRDADDALQEAWLRYSRTDTSDVDNVGGWLTTVTARVCLNALRSRKTRREEPLDLRLPDPVVTRDPSGDPAGEAELADSVGLAMMVVLDTLAPAERLAFVLHDMFAVPFDDIAEITGRSSTSVRQLASRARRRVQGVPTPNADIRRQREVVDAFFAAARDGDFAALVSVLDPEVVVTGDVGALHPAGLVVTRGAENVAASALSYAHPDREVVAALVNGSAGVVIFGPDGNVFSIMEFTVVDGRVVAINALGDPARIAAIDVSAVR